MKSKRCVIGIDTSNYTTSVAAADDNGRIISDRRSLLYVKEGERGLRQSDALFQHIKNLPEIIRLVKEDISDYTICAVSSSDRPRPVEGSYMPVFLAGDSFASCMASALGVPHYRFSHQEGHIRACTQAPYDDILCFHNSGGTCELIDVSRGEFKITGGSLDISFGQLIDRAGVKMGYSFPCGKALDEVALKGTVRNLLKPVAVKDGWFNLSGTETQVMKAADMDENIVCDLFDTITQIIACTLNQKAAGRRVILCGGVFSSRYIREHLKDYLHKDVDFKFGEAEYSTDNAVGTARLGGDILWPEIL